jgi:ERCC4-type nuclease
VIRVDPRRGSGEFKRLLVRLGVTAKRRHLPFADFSFSGSGPNGIVRVGVERKTLSEIVMALQDSRLVGHQLPGLLGSPNGRRRFDYVYLIVEGSYGPDPRTGVLMQGRHEVGHGYHRHLYENVEKFLMTLELHGQIRVRRTNGKIATAYFVAALYRWFQKDWYAHKSAYKVEEDTPEQAILTQRTLDRKAYAQWPGIGWVRSSMVEKGFPCVMAAACADIPEWRKISWISRKGKRQSIGPKTAERLVTWLRGKHKGSKGR